MGRNVQQFPNSPVAALLDELEAREPVRGSKRVLTYDEIVQRFPEGIPESHRFDLSGLSPEQRAALYLPNADYLAGDQEVDAVERMEVAPKHAIYWRLPEMQAVAGAVDIGDLVLGGARTGGGKSLFYQNVYDDMIEAGHTGLYIGTEQDAHVLATKWACARRRIHPRLVLKPERDEIDTPEHKAAKRAVQEELAIIRTGEYAKRAILASADARRLDLKTLRKWVLGAVEKYGIDFVVIDHIDRMNPQARDPWAEQAEAIVATKEMAVKYGIVAFLASQLKNQPDRSKLLLPPSLEDFAGRADKTREADLVLGIYRPARHDLTKDERKMARSGELSMKQVWMPNTMGVEVLKHRVDDSRLGQVALLHVNGHRLESRQRTEKWMP